MVIPVPATLRKVQLLIVLPCPEVMTIAPSREASNVKPTREGNATCCYSVSREKRVQN